MRRLNVWACLGLTAFLAFFCYEVNQLLNPGADSSSSSEAAGGGSPALTGAALADIEKRLRQEVRPSCCFALVPRHAPVFYFG